MSSSLEGGAGRGLRNWHPARNAWLDELPQLLRLALPVILAEIGWMTMGLVDTVMVGPLGPQAIGAVGLASSLFIAAAIFGMGLLLGLDTLVAQAFGAGRRDECHRWLVHGLLMSAVLAVPITALLLAWSAWLPRFGLHPSVLPLTRPYLEVLIWSLPPLLAYASFRRYLQGIGLVRPVMFALLSANLVNVGGNWVLIYGHLGFPAMGTSGSAWATVVSRVYMAAVLLWAILADDGRRGAWFWAARHIEPARLRRLLALGLPAAGQVTLEVGVFAAATALAGRLEPHALAAHQIALNIASFVFMIPLGLASAAAVLVGHAVGRRDARGAGRAGWTALGLIAAVMFGIALVLALAPRALVRVFSPDETVLALGASLLVIAAVFQIFDGLQAVGTGILRGVGDTHTPMLWNFAGHWLLGLPAGYWLCFHAGWGVRGLWVGLSIGLIVCGAVLVLTWARRVRTMVALMPAPTAASAG